MFNNYIKIAVRNLWKNKVLTSINVIGLGVSLSVALVIYLIVHYHFSFDDFHQDQERIYRVTTASFIEGTEFPNPGVSVPLFQTVPDEISGIDETAPMIRLYSDIVVPQQDEATTFKRGNKIIFTDDGYFEILKYSWLAGTPNSLTEPFNVVLSESMASRYYGHQEDYQSLIGKVITVNDSIDLSISGVVAELLEPTEFIFNVFISLPSFYSDRFNIYRGWHGVNSDNQFLIKLQEGVTSEQVEAQFPGFLSKHLEKENPERIQLLQPLRELHFNARLSNLSGISIVKPKLYALSVIAFFLLLLASFNFINLTTSNGLSRLNELTLRKSLGSNTFHLILQQLTETLIVFAVSAIVCVFFASLILTGFREFIPTYLTFDSIWESDVIFVICGAIVLIALMAGLFPAFSLVRTSIKSFVSGGSQNRNIRMGIANQTLVVFQFTITLVLIISTIFIYRQTEYSIKKDLGFNPNDVITFKSGGTAKDQGLLNELKQIPEIDKTSLSCRPPLGLFSMSQVFKYENTNGTVEILAEHKDANYDYMDIYQFNVLAGSSLHPEKARECLINQRFLQELGIVDPGEIIGSKLSHDEGDLTIVGIVEDFHFQKTEHQIGPLVIKSFPVSRDYFHIKLTDLNQQDAIQKCQLVWEAMYPDKEFKYAFLENDIEKMYRSEKTTSLFLFWASVCTVFLSCMGILGLAIFSTNRKIKEIGIRKVNGAKVSEILSLLNKDFVRWVGIAFIIATPIAWFALGKWLQNYAYQIELSWWVFALAGLITLAIALLTVSWQSWKAATRNPVEALKYE